MHEIRDLYPPDRHRSVRRNPTGTAVVLVVAGVLALGLFEAFALLLRPEATLLFRPGGLRDLTTLIVGVGLGALLASSLTWMFRNWIARPRRGRRPRRATRVPNPLPGPVPTVATRKPAVARSRLEAPVRAATIPEPAGPVSVDPEPVPARPRVEVVVRSRKVSRGQGADTPPGRYVA